MTIYDNVITNPERCDYCKKEKPAAEVMMMANTGKTPTWICVACMTGSREIFLGEPDCPACQVTLALVDTTIEAHQEYMRTRQPIALRVPPKSGYPHKRGCTNDFGR